MPRGHIDPGDRDLRRRIRQRIGTLRLNRVARKTQERYVLALRYFEVWCAMARRNTISTDAELDETVCLYVECLWCEGESRGRVGDLLSGLQWALQRRRILNGSWERFRTWGMLELPIRAPPMPVTVACALSGLALQQQQLGLAAILLAAFDGMMRTTEFLTLTASQVCFGEANALILLPLTKSGQRHGGAESVFVRDPQAVLLLRVACQRCGSSTSPLINMKPSAFRAWLKRAKQVLGVGHLQLQPYSYRRGGATWRFQQGAPLAELLAQGRWENSRTARIYITEAALFLGNLTIAAETAQVTQQYVRLLAEFVRRNGS